MDKEQRMPMSVFLAICSEINKYQVAQFAAARIWIELSPDLLDGMIELATLIDDEDKRRWLIGELRKS